MLSLGTVLCALALGAHAAQLRRHPLLPREYITPDALEDSYDYIIAGGGLAGLVVASKLAESGEHTVLVLEAGGDAAAYTPNINTPTLAYVNGTMFNPETGTDYMYQTTAQSGAGDRVMTWPRGKMLGGSSAGNGMYMVRPHAKEINAMHGLIASDDNKAYADAWTWESLFDAMKGVETFTPPTEEAQETAGMRYKMESHGTSGRLQTTFSYQVPIVSHWLPTLEAAGIKISDDAYAGDNTGGFISTLSINPSNWTRSFSRNAYIDVLPPLSNLHILLNAAVTKITFAAEKNDGNVVATGVEFAAAAGAEAVAVKADKEVILSGGAVGSPHMLLVSGVGPKEVLEPLDIPVQVDLPGVGEHLQDHVIVKPAFEVSEDTQGDIFASGSEFARSAEFNGAVNAATSYIDGATLFGGADAAQAFVDGIAATYNNDSALAAYYQGSNDEVNAGYRAIYKALLDEVYPDAGLLEMLLSINYPGQILLQVAVQTPLSQGRLSINSASIFDPPVLDPNYLDHPGDIAIVRAGVRLARRVAGMAPLSSIITGEAAPGADVTSDEAIDAWIRETAETEFHPGCTCAMLPRNLGGVIDASLTVYGTANVRVVDGSVFPLSMSAHLMAPIYGLAEKAASLILEPPAAAGSDTKDDDKDDDGKDDEDDEDETDGAAQARLNPLLAVACGLFALVSVL